MANVIVNIPVLGGVGPGAGADVSGLAAEKTIVITNAQAGAPIAQVVGERGNLEASSDGGVTWVPLTGLCGGDGPRVLKGICCDQIRYNRVSVGSTLPVISISSAGVPNTNVPILPPAGSGAGAQADVSALPTVKTLEVTGGDFGINGTEQGRFEVSTDGGATWSTLVDMTGNNIRSLPSVVANLIRYFRIKQGATVPVMRCVGY